MKSKVNTIMHPVRMRLIQTLIKEKKLTVQQISEYMPDVPQATLYRHINKLLESEILEVLEENQIRGTIEKAYGLRKNGFDQIKKDLEESTKEEHFNYFFSFLLSLLGDFEEYLKKDTLDFKEDGLMYRTASLYLTDDEFKELITEIQKLLLAAFENDPSKDRMRRTFTTIVIPEGKR